MAVSYNAIALLRPAHVRKNRRILPGCEGPRAYGACSADTRMLQKSAAFAHETRRVGRRRREKLGDSADA
jgi:hypothetical protein